jgi:hypothetical protein
VPNPRSFPLGLALALCACSASFHSGSTATKPASKTTAAQPTSTSTQKPIAAAPSGATAEDAADDPEPDAGQPTREGPTRLASANDPTRAVCRIADEQLQSLCHRALDPIADANAEVFMQALAEDVVMLRPGADGRPERLAGAQQVRRAMNAAGGVRGLVHTDETSRLVGTLIKDCRDCRRAFVAVEANTLAGAVLVTMNTSSPPKVTRIELHDQPARRAVRTK